MCCLLTHCVVVRRLPCLNDCGEFGNRQRRLLVKRSASVLAARSFDARSLVLSAEFLRAESTSERIERVPPELDTSYQHDARASEGCPVGGKRRSISSLPLKWSSV